MRWTARENGPKFRLLLNHVFSQDYVHALIPTFSMISPLIQPTHFSFVSTTHNWWDYQFYLGSLSHIYTPLLPFLHCCAKFPWKCLFLPSCYCLFCKQKINLNCGKSIRLILITLLHEGKRRSKTVSALIQIKESIDSIFL